MHNEGASGSHMTPGASRSVLLSLLGGALLGTAGTAAALGPDTGTPALLGFLRLAFGAAALVLVLPWFGGRRTHLPTVLRRPGVWVMGICTGIYQPLFFGATARAGVAVSTLVAVGCIPAFAGFIGWVVFRHRPSRVWFAATAVAVFGLVLRSWGRLDVDDATGLLMALGSGLCVGAYVNAAKVELHRGGHPLEVPASAYLIASVLLFPFVCTDLGDWSWTWGTLGLALFLGVVTMALANALQISGLRGLRPAPASTLMLADPLTATVLGILVLHEGIAPIGILGLLLVMAGLVLQSVAQAGAEEEDPAPATPA